MKLFSGVVVLVILLCPAIFAAEEGAATARAVALAEFSVPRLVYFGGLTTLGGAAGSPEERSLAVAFLMNPALNLGSPDSGLLVAGGSLSFLGLRALAPLSSLWREDLDGLGRFGLFSMSDLANYETWRQWREAPTSGLRPSTWKGFETHELLLAPFNSTMLQRPLVWGSLLGEGALNLTFALLGKEGPTAVWDTGQTYEGSEQVPLVLGLSETAVYALASNTLIAAGEEAVFRGIIFQEMCEILGEVPARLIDMFVFPLAHVPNWISKNVSPINMLTEFLWLAADTWLLDSAYLEGGLPESIALHAHLNVTNRMIDWAFGAGVPQRPRP